MVLKQIKKNPTPGAKAPRVDAVLTMVKGATATGDAQDGDAATAMARQPRQHAPRRPTDSLVAGGARPNASVPGTAMTTNGARRGATPTGGARDSDARDGDARSSGAWDRDARDGSSGDGGARDGSARNGGARDSDALDVDVRDGGGAGRRRAGRRHTGRRLAGLYHI